ncbi:hypothetical protein [Paenibacillus sp. AR247]|uniref:hypothetical protein n=1 Tax=Paenibacillus sp. AR247 TaxID=1631599 RepID=UPI00215846A6|nr:hypothetical protein [Paenibacillus sp. AR247]
MLKRSSVFRNFLISYIVILLIPCVGGYISYLTSISVTQSISIDNSLIQLEKSQELLEHRMAEVEGMTRQIAISQEVNMLMNDRHQVQDVYGLVEGDAERADLWANFLAREPGNGTGRRGADNRADGRADPASVPGIQGFHPGWFRRVL